MGVTVLLSLCVLYRRHGASLSGEQSHAYMRSYECQVAIPRQNRDQYQFMTRTSQRRLAGQFRPERLSRQYSTLPIARRQHSNSAVSGGAGWCNRHQRGRNQPTRAQPASSTASAHGGCRARSKSSSLQGLNKSSPHSSGICVQMCRVWSRHQRFTVRRLCCGSEYLGANPGRSPNSRRGTARRGAGLPPQPGPGAEHSTVGHCASR